MQAERLKRKAERLLRDIQHRQQDQDGPQATTLEDGLLDRAAALCAALLKSDEERP